MRAYLPAYEMETPRDLTAALLRMAREPGAWRAFAGGTDLMVLLEAGKLPHRKFLNIWNLGELRGIAVTAEHLTMGALTTYAEVQRHEILAREFPLLCRAAAETGSVATQNRGTLGGNIANASPAADSPPALIVYGAEIEIVSTGGARWVPYASFHTGYKIMNLQAGELIRAIRLARPRGARGNNISAKWGRGGRRRFRRFVLRGRGAWRRDGSRKFGSRWGAWRQRCCVRCGWRNYCAGSGRTMPLCCWLRRTRCALRSRRLTTCVRRGAIAATWRGIYSRNFWKFWQAERGMQNSSETSRSVAGRGRFNCARETRADAGRRTSGGDSCARRRNCGRFRVR